MKIINKVLLDLNGDPIPMPGAKPPKDGEAPDPAKQSITVANVLSNCCLAPTETGKPRSNNETIERYDFAVKFHRLAIDESVEITAALATGLQEDVKRLYTTLVAGQMIPLLDGKTVN